jgi:hypothetical protein
MRRTESKLIDVEGGKDPANSSIKQFSSTKN